MRLKKITGIILSLALVLQMFPVVVGSADSTNSWPSITYQAEGSSLSHGTGRLDGDGWLCQTGVDTANRHMIYGPYVTNIQAGRCKAIYSLKIDNNTVNDDRIVQLDVYDATTGTTLADRYVTRKQFNAAGVYQEFSLSFKNTAGHSLEFRVYWYGNAYTKVDYIKVETQSYTYEAEASSISHGTGRNDGDGWLCQTGIDAANKHMVYGPYVTNIPAGTNRAFFRMKVDNNSANDDNIAKIDVRDNTTGTELVSKIITRKQFNAASIYQTFYLDYTQIDQHSTELRVYWYGTSYLKVDCVGVEAVSYNSSNWMGSVSDSKSLRSLSIPGTHDSGALYEPVAGTAKCQNLTIAQQLSAGVRFLDIRCRHIDNAFTIHHGSVYQNMNFDDVLNACYSFLNANPTETIIMSVKEEHTPSNNTRSFVDTFNSYVSANPSKWYLSAAVPNLGDVRGKIVLVRRFGGSSDGIDCSNWPDKATFTTSSGGTTIKIQDEYEVSDNSNKWTAVQNMYNEAKSQNSSWLYINYTSGYKSILFVPSITTVSNYINPKIVSYFTANPSGRFGISPMDFADAEKCALIIATNFN